MYEMTETLVRQLRDKKVEAYAAYDAVYADRKGQGGVPYVVVTPACTKWLPAVEDTKGDVWLPFLAQLRVTVMLPVRSPAGTAERMFETVVEPVLLAAGCEAAQAEEPKFAPQTERLGCTRLYTLRGFARKEGAAWNM